MWSNPRQGLTCRCDDLAPRRRRDPRFRQAVLRAYEHRCAVTGFRAALGGQYLGCEAAHVQWHAYQGPDTVDNGLVVEPTLHKLFDVGAWSLTDDRRVLVSRDFTGTDATVERIRGLHGRRMRDPVAGEPPLRVESIRWHRELELGGVFKGPGLGG
jgi:putative restriction endonuclease